MHNLKFEVLMHIHIKQIVRIILQSIFDGDKFCESIYKYVDIKGVWVGA